ncbi:MAG: DUF3592 domain-containing protein [Eubacteriales bacterium]|nr:DUF3592 domain-containing protein [Eubacteriales bacterium]
MSETGSTFRKQWIIAIILTVIGLAVLGYSVISMNQQKKASSGYETVQGQVTGHQEVAGRDSQDNPITRYAEIVEYQVDGSRFQIVSTISSTNPASIGTLRTVQYDPAQPAQAVLPGAQAQTRLVLLIGGSAHSLLGLFLIFQQTRKSRA